MLTVTASDTYHRGLQQSQWKYIVISARVHPGETVSSYKIQGIMNFLILDDSKAANHLRSMYVFKIIPMLNPDGVMVGNYRTNFAGVDLNRRW